MRTSAALPMRFHSACGNASSPRTSIAIRARSVAVHASSVAARAAASRSITATSASSSATASRTRSRTRGFSIAETSCATCFGDRRAQAVGSGRSTASSSASSSSRNGSVCRNDTTSRIACARRSRVAARIRSRVIASTRASCAGVDARGSRSTRYSASAARAVTTARPSAASAARSNSSVGANAGRYEPRTAAIPSAVEAVSRRSTVGAVDWSRRSACCSSSDARSFRRRFVSARAAVPFSGLSPVWRRGAGAPASPRASLDETAAGPAPTAAKRPSRAAKSSCAICSSTPPTVSTSTSRQVRGVSGRRRRGAAHGRCRRRAPRSGRRPRRGAV